MVFRCVLQPQALKFKAQRHTIGGLCWLWLLLDLQRLQGSRPAIDDGCLDEKCFPSG